jgi:WhiB family transcriptional regulator, redox-sensing transcriptional regulator
MAVSRSTASVDSEPATCILDGTTGQQPCLLVPVPFTHQASWARVIRYASCADASLDPDQWFPVSADAGKARQEAAAAIAICTTCPVRAQCLALSLRHWDIGQHGVWGGLVAAERAAMRRGTRNRAAASARKLCPAEREPRPAGA